MRKQTSRRQILEVSKPGKSLELDYEDSAGRLVSSYTINYNFGPDCYGSFHAGPGQTVTVEHSIDKKTGAHQTVITKIPDQDDA